MGARGTHARAQEDRGVGARVLFEKGPDTLQPVQLEDVRRER